MKYVKKELILLKNNTCTCYFSDWKVEVTGDYWARATYQLICRNQYECANIAFSYLQEVMATTEDFTLVTSKVKVNMSVLCNLKQLAKNHWMPQLIVSLLLLGSDHRTLTVYTGDTYLHAVVKISLVTGKVFKYTITVFTMKIHASMR